MADGYQPHLQLATSATTILHILDWSQIEAEFGSSTHPVHTVLAAEDINTNEAAYIFTCLLASHLEQHGALKPSCPYSHNSGGRPHCEKYFEALQKTPWEQK